VAWWVWRRWLRVSWRGALDVGLTLEALRERGFVALDLETTGLDPRRDAVVSAAAVRFAGGRPVDRYTSLVDPGRPIPPASTAIHGITDAMVAGAPDVGRVLEDLGAFTAGEVVVGHAVDFDLAILDRERRARGVTPLPGSALDTRRLAAALNPGWTALDLEAVAARYGLGVPGRHTAEGDALGAGHLLLALLPEIERRGCRTVAEALWLQKTALPHGA
jgi:DNA polymerase III epsilon subunit family exonuclease